MKLGDFVEISVGIADLGQSLPFLERLGFVKLDQAWEPWPWAILTDGMITLNLSQYSVPGSPVLNYFASDMDERIGKLQANGLDIVPVHQRELPEVLGVLETPGGIGISLLKYSTKRIPKLSITEEVKCGRFSELAVPVDDLSATLRFWSGLGFEKTEAGNSPYPWALMTDQLISLGFYQTSRLKRAAIVYRSEKLKDRIEQLSTEGFELLEVAAAPGTDFGRFEIKSTDDQFQLLMESAG